MRVLLIDNYDSYTYNLYHLIAATFGAPPTVLVNDAPELTPRGAGRFDAIVVSPGPGHPGRPRDLGRTFAVLDGTPLPVLGVCLGHQAIGQLAGAEVLPAPAPAHGRVDRIRHTGQGLFAALPQDFAAVRYHSLCVRVTPDALLDVDAWTADGVTMALRHRDRPWWGVQFHPESVSTQHGARLLANFRDLAGGRAPSARRRPRVPPQRRRPTRAWALRYRRLGVEVAGETAFRQVCAGQRYAFWLDTSRVDAGRARFSYIGGAAGPHAEILRDPGGMADRVEILDAGGRLIGTKHGTIFDVLRERIAERAVPHDPRLPFDLRGGYVGYLGYEAKRHCGSPNTHRAATADAVWIAATRYVVVDHAAGDTWLVALVRSGSTADAADADAWLDRTAAALYEAPGPAAAPAPAATGSGDPGAIAPGLAGTLRVCPDRYQDDIRECKRQLVAGESYEICLTNELTAPFTDDPFALYLRQRKGNPAPYAAFLRCDDVAVLSSSPECFLRVTADGIVESRPIKGTAAREADADADEAARTGLATSPKTRAENLMIVDLVRNDLGRVCELGTVGVPHFMTVESYATVHQLVSTVRGRLRPDVDAVEAVRACFPGGSMTGAPKLRTMEIIGRLEDRARGVYSGALGYLSLDGAADLSIVIRTAVVRDGLMTVGAGGAIVLDSDPADEYEEMLLKLRAPLRGLALDEPADGAVSELSSPR